MKFLVDAQLPKRMAIWLRNEGHDVLHTLDLPAQNRTHDREINEMSLAQKRVVITKDSDFVNSFLLGKGPFKLLLISTGNITNNELLAILENNLNEIVLNFESSDFVEINRSTLITHL